MRSAALRKMAERSAKGKDSHDSLAARAEEIARLMSLGEACLYLAMGCWWFEGLAWVCGGGFLSCEESD